MIVVANVANLASVGCKIVIERDWIVVIASGDESRLATMNAVFRTINLTTLVIAPAFAGIIFDFVGNSAAAATIGIWNIASVVVEYYLLLTIYKSFPDLAEKRYFNDRIRFTSIFIIINILYIFKTNTDQLN